MRHALLSFLSLLAFAPAAAAETWADLPMDTASAKVVQEPDAPGGFVYELRGRVKLGDNPCLAEGRSARLAQRLDDGILVVTPQISDASRESKECLGPVAPVFQELTATLRGDATVGLVVVRHVESLNNDVSIESLFNAPLRQDDVIVLSGRVTPWNAGANPDAFALNVKLKYEVAANPCLAEAYDTSVVEEEVEGVLYVKVVKTLKTPQMPVCAQVYRPVVKTVKRTLRGLKSRINDIRIENVRSFGNSVSLSHYL